jgi:cbb3-type cytochrome oxidase maturation protein
MKVVMFLFICSLLVAGGFLIAFIWNVKNGQYDDEFSSANRILFDDLKPKEVKKQ